MTATRPNSATPVLAVHASLIGIVVIGRNEGERLRRCLQALAGTGTAVVYVDSGSSDQSVNVAAALGVTVVELDMRAPFTASRARNVGLARISDLGRRTTYVQFVDGDCELCPRWLEEAAAMLDNHPDLAAVCGILRERHPRASLFNRVCDVEWNAATGDVESCGGVAMYRTAALAQVGGFNPSIRAGEEPELCSRLRQRGWRIRRIASPMASHDADLRSFRQWWKRCRRGGYGSLDVLTRFGLPKYRRQVRSTRLWTLGWLIALSAILAAYPLLHFRAATAALLALLLLPLLQALRIAARIRRSGAPAPTALAYGLLTMLSKWPQLLGHLQYYREAPHLNDTASS